MDAALVHVPRIARVVWLPASLAADVDRLWQTIAASHLSSPDVSSGTGFGGSAGLRVSRKIFAMFIDGELVVKLPALRVQELVAHGIGRQFDPGHGRLMKEWAVVPPGASRRWPALVVEARSFVGGA